MISEKFWGIIIVILVSVVRIFIVADSACGYTDLVYVKGLAWLQALPRRQHPALSMCLTPPHGSPRQEKALQRLSSPCSKHSAAPCPFPKPSCLDLRPATQQTLSRKRAWPSETLTLSKVRSFKGLAVAHMHGVHSWGLPSSQPCCL